MQRAAEAEALAKAYARGRSSKWPHVFLRTKLQSVVLNSYREAVRALALTYM